MSDPGRRVALSIVSVASSLLGFAVVVLALVGYAGNWNIFGHIGNRIGQSLLITAGSFAVIGAAASQTRGSGLGLRIALTGAAGVVGVLVGAYSLALGIHVAFFAGAFALAGGITVLSLGPPRFEKVGRAVVFVALAYGLLLLPALLYLPTSGAGGEYGLRSVVWVSVSGLLFAISTLAVFAGLFLTPRGAPIRTATPDDTS